MASSDPPLCDPDNDLAGRKIKCVKTRVQTVEVLKAFSAFYSHSGGFFCFCLEGCNFHIPQKRHATSTEVKIQKRGKTAVVQFSCLAAN